MLCWRGSGRLLWNNLLPWLSRSSSRRPPCLVVQIHVRWSVTARVCSRYNCRPWLSWVVNSTQPLPLVVAAFDSQWVVLARRGPGWVATAVISPIARRSRSWSRVCPAWYRLGAPSLLRCDDVRLDFVGAGMALPSSLVDLVCYSGLVVRIRRWILVGYRIASQPLYLAKQIYAGCPVAA